MANFTDVELVDGPDMTALNEPASGAFVSFNRANEIAYLGSPSPIELPFVEAAFADLSTNDDVFFVSMNALEGTPPSVSALVPVDGSGIDPAGSISLRVNFPEGEVRTIIAAVFPNIGRTELIHDGSQFYAPYTALSSATSGSGYRDYVIRRDPRWDDAPQLKVYSVDSLAQEL